MNDSIFKNSLIIIRTNKNMVCGSHAIYTKKYEDMNPDKFNYDVMICCDSFELCETINGDVIVTCKRHLHHSKTIINHRISLKNVTEIEIFTDYDI